MLLSSVDIAVGDIVPDGFTVALSTPELSTVGEAVSIGASVSLSATVDRTVGLTVSYGCDVAFLPELPLVGDTVAFTSKSELGPTVAEGVDVDIPLTDEVSVGASVPDWFPVALSPSEDAEVGA